MCGRYALFGPQSRYREQFGTIDEFALPPRFNIAPTETLPVVLQAADGRRRFQLAQWGLIPSWVRDPAEFSRPINARAETAATKPMFRHAFHRQRILVPADAFYEWRSMAGGRQPYLIRMRDQTPFGMAGLLERWQGPAGELTSFTILTTAANSLLARIHDRMPAIIPAAHYQQWLDPGNGDIAGLQGLLGSYPAGLMETWPVSRKVNSPANDGPDLLEPEGPDGD